MLSPFPLVPRRFFFETIQFSKLISAFFTVSNPILFFISSARNPLESVSTIKADILPSGPLAYVVITLAMVPFPTQCFFPFKMKLSLLSSNFVVKDAGSLPASGSVSANAIILFPELVLDRYCFFGLHQPNFEESFDRWRYELKKMYGANCPLFLSSQWLANKLEYHILDRHTLLRLDSQAFRFCQIRELSYRLPFLPGNNRIHSL